MSKCIDTIYQDDWDSGWFRRLLDFIRGIERANEDARASDSVETANDTAPPTTAPAMLMTSRDIGPLISQTTARLEDWQTRRATRRQLVSLDDRMLKDIGISRCDAEYEYRKPFWRF